MHRKTLLATGGVVVTLVLALYFVAAGTLSEGYLQLEEAAMRRNASRLHVALQNTLKVLESKCGDWSN